MLFDKYNLLLPISVSEISKAYCMHSAERSQGLLPVHYQPVFNPSENTLHMQYFYSLDKGLLNVIDN